MLIFVGDGNGVEDGNVLELPRMLNYTKGEEPKVRNVECNDG